ncbi:putative reductive dehalogenase (rdhA), partial [marine sediment metagenome]
YVKNREFGDTTQEMDWDIYNRFDYDAYGTTQATIDYLGQEEYDRLRIYERQLKSENIKNNKPGWKLRDYAIREGLPGESAAKGSDHVKFVGNRGNSPTSQGNLHDPPLEIPPWTGTPEEASRMMRTVIMLRGGIQVGFCEIDDKSRRFFYSKRGGKIHTFEDIDDAYETGDKLACPNKAKYVASYTAPMSEEMLRRAPSAIAASTVNHGYSYGRIINNGVSKFLWGIGYMGLGGGNNSWKIHPAFAVWTGIGEESRMHQNFVSPEQGCSARTFAIVSELPMESTPPIDAGIWKYCHTCKKCAQGCPGEALDKEGNEPTWDTPYGPTNTPGQKAFPFSFGMCRAFWMQNPGGCCTCMSLCPFSHKYQGLIHDVINATIGTTSIFNGFFKNMDDMLGYGFEADQEAWWDLPPLVHGIWAPGSQFQQTVNIKE